MNLPTTIAEIDQIIKDQVQEDLHLDYKESAAIDKSKRQEIAKDVSAFANSDGGILIYGVIEDNNNIPINRDSGIDYTKHSREWLEQVISSHIAPRLDGVRIVPIQVSASRSYYAVEIPKSFRGPHQASDKRYYKRSNFQSVPMEDYEINDIRNRRQVTPPLIEVGINIRRRIVIYLYVSNIGNQTAEEVSFDLPDEVRAWAEKDKAKLFIDGVKYFPPKRTFSFRYGHAPALLSESNSSLSKFDITVSYKHPELGQRISEVFHIDLMDFMGSFTEESEIYQHSRETKESIKELTNEVKKLNEHIARFSPVAGATGLDLSISTLRNLKHVVSGDEQFEKLNPTYLEYNIFMEILGVDIETAYRLSDFFYRGNDANGLNEVEGVTEEIAEKIKKYFTLQGEI